MFYGGAVVKLRPYKDSSMTFIVYEHVFDNQWKGSQRIFEKVFDDVELKIKLIGREDNVMVTVKYRKYFDEDLCPQLN